MKKPVIDMEGPSRTGLWIIRKDGKDVAKIVAAYPKRGDGDKPVYVSVVHYYREGFDHVEPQSQVARGGFYDKAEACISRCTIGGVKPEDGRWEASMRDAGFEVIQYI